MQIITKNLLDVDYGIICQQVNCKGVMGGGLALQIKKKWPKVYNQYKRQEPILGFAQIVRVTDNLVVANLFAQDSFGSTPGYRYTNYTAFAQSLTMLRTIGVRGVMPIYFPYLIGCGLGGGNWDFISTLIEENFPEAIICQLPGG